MTYQFEFSGIRQRWRHRNFASPASICEISFRIVNLHAALKTGRITDPQVIRHAAVMIDEDLETWKAGVPRNWIPVTIDAAEGPVSACFDGKRHIYPNLWVAEIWSNWRTLRILVHQLMLQNERRFNVPGDVQISISTIQQLSTELCIAFASFTGTPRRSLGPCNCKCAV
jgi:hypothetical protein